MNKSVATAVLLVCCAVGYNTHAATVTVHVGPASNFYSFSPDPVSINAGDTVQWVWDSGPHSATSGTPGRPSGVFDSGTRNAGATPYSHTFSSTGNVPYYCAVHGELMTGTVQVAGGATPTPSATATPTPSPSATATPTPSSTPTATPTATPTPTATATPTPTPILPLITKGVIRIDLQPIATNLQAPSDLVPFNDGSDRIVVLQQRGVIVLLKAGQVLQTPFLDLSARLVQFGDPSKIPGPRYDERGLLGLAFHPGFADANSPGYRKLYTFTNEPVSGTADFTVPMTGAFDNQVVIAEWQVSASNPDIVDPATRREILRIDHPQFNHNGGQLGFRPGAPYLYISIGDGGAGNDVGPGHNPATGNAQDTTTVLGKILRIDPLDPALNNTNDPPSANGKYRIPASNPFVANPAGAANVGEIYAYGLRNPFRFSFDPQSGRFIVADVGQNNVEEIDIVEAGRNYGWNKKEGTFLFNPADASVKPDPAPNPAFTEPVAEYSHSDGIAVIGGFLYRGNGIPALQGKYVFGDLSGSFAAATGRLFYTDDLNAGTTIHELRIGNEDRPLGLFVKAFGRDASGEIYLLGDSNIGPSGNGGVVLKLAQAQPAPALLNLSTRMDVLTDDKVLIGGFIILGGAPKAMILRALGPSLTVNGQPVPGTMQNPSLELHDSAGKLIDFNDDWQANPQKQELTNRNIAPSDPREAALFDSLQPGAYTAVLRGVNNDTGIGLVELYDVDQAASANPVNISTRGFVQTDNNVMIGGFIVGGNTLQRVLVRAIGPSLASLGVRDALQDPQLELRDKDGALLLSNDNWKSTQQADIEATGTAPSDDRESAIVTNLGPSNYTAIVRGANQTSGVALVEVFRLAK